MSAFPITEPWTLSTTITLAVVIMLTVVYHTR